MTHLARVARQTAEISWNALSAASRSRVSLLLLDTLGCALAGRRLGFHQSLVEAVGASGGPAEATIWFEHRGAPAAHAALLNGTVAHHVELDDGHPAASLHGGVTIVPAALAAAERAGATGVRLLESIAAGYGAAVACGRPLLDGITAHRLHPPGIVGCFGAAAAAARALGSSADETAGALSLAGCLLPFAPFESFTKGAPVKDMYAGWPAYMGVMTALMAGDGVTGPVDAFEAAEDGVAQLVCHGLPSALADVDPNEVAGTQFKAFATCRSVQPALTALAALLPLDPGTIDGVAVETYPFAVELSADSDPGTAIGAKTSIPYCVAAYLLDGEVGPASFHPAVLGDPRRGLLASLVTVRVAADMIQPLRRGARIEVRLTDGTVRRHAVRAARWSAEDPATERDIREKFRRLAGRRAEAIERAVADLPDASDVERLRSALAP